MFKSILQCTRGYTFIELLIAISILGLVITPFLALFTSGYLAINNAGLQTAAVNLCREQMETVKSLHCSTIKDLYISENNSSYFEEAIPGYPIFKRTTSVQPFLFSSQDQPPLELELLLIEITVFWRQRETEQSETLSCYLNCQ